MTIFKGSATAMVTPFTNDGCQVNYDAFKKMIDFQIEQGTSALLFLGTTGEPPTLTETEKTKIISFAVGYVNKRVPVIAGAGSNSTQSAIKNSQLYQSLGSDALLHVTPYYNKCTQNGLAQHFGAIASSTSLPIIVYNVPSRTGVNLLPETYAQLLKHKNIIATKEASGNIEQICEISRLYGKDIDIYCGDDGIILPVLCLGGKGVISVASNVAPKSVSNICAHFFANQIDKARAVQFQINPLIKALFCEVNPIPVKCALNLMGMQAGAVRPPLTVMEEIGKEKLKAELLKLNLI